MGMAIEKHAAKDCKVIVVGRPANTNTLICSHIPPKTHLQTNVCGWTSVSVHDELAQPLKKNEDHQNHTEYIYRFPSVAHNICKHTRAVSILVWAGFINAFGLTSSRALYYLCCPTLYISAIQDCL